MLQPLLPAGISLEVARLVFSVAFFAVAYLLAMHPSALTKLLGRITGPALIVLIVAVVGAALFNPVDAVRATHGAYEGNAVMAGFQTGYQTMDLLASLTFGIIIATNIRELGVTDDAGLTREVSRAGVFAGLLMGLIHLRSGRGGPECGPRHAGCKRTAPRSRRLRPPCTSAPWERWLSLRFSCSLV